jgi:hypothetical protein
VSKKRSATEVVPAAVEMAPEPSKKKKKKNVEVASEPVVEIAEKKKSKKRQRLDDSTDEKPKSKKLNILSQIENPFERYRNLQSNVESSKKAAEQTFAVPLPSQKLKKVLPQSLKVEKKKKKKQVKSKIAEPVTSLPRPVWTSSGTFIEEPISPPFKFTSTQYEPLNFGGAVAFEAKKKKKSAVQKQTSMPVNDFKYQQMMKNKNRDGSKKNLQGLLSKTKTF